MRDLPKINKFFNASFLFTNLLIPIGVLLIYCYSYAFICSHLLLEGVNFVFTSRLSKYLLIFVVLISLLVIILRLTREDERSETQTLREKVSLSHLPLLLLPLTPVVQYLINNQEILSLLDILLVLGFFILFSFIYIFAIPALVGKYSSVQILMGLGLAFAFTMINMSVLSQNFNWFGHGGLKTQLIYFGIVFLLIWGMLKTNNKKFLYLILLVYFLSNSCIQFISYVKDSEKATLPVTENKLLSMAEGRLPESTPNIYLLVYDAYVPNETMMGYGIDNSPQEKYLKDQGFVLYPSVYSVDAITIRSMSRVLNASTEYGGNPRRAVSGDGFVQNTLQNLGYKSYGLFPNDYLFRGIGSSYDFTTLTSHMKPSELIISAVLVGEFRWDIGFDSLSRDEYLDSKQRILGSISEKQIFLYSHSNVPGHSQGSGVCLPNETELFRERLLAANTEMHQDIETITKFDPEAIVIVAGDHGPYLTKNCFFDVGTSEDYDISEISRLDIQDRFGTFLAIKWPTEEYDKYDDITVLQDLFPAVFAYLYQDARFLEVKINPEIIGTIRISEASVKNGTIVGGINDGEPLFLSEN